MGRKEYKIYEVCGQAICDVTIKVVAESEEDAVNRANNLYRNSMCDYCDGNVGFDESTLEGSDELVYCTVEEVEFTDDYIQEKGKFHCDNDCANCDMADYCDKFVESDEEDEEEDYEDD